MKVSLRQRKKRKPSLRQRKAVENMVENGGNVNKAMLDAGYSPATAHTPDKLTESIAFHNLCEEMGLTDGLVVAALVHDIKKKKLKRSSELSLAADILGIKKRTPNLIVPVQINVNQDREKYA